MFKRFGDTTVEDRIRETPLRPTEHTTSRRDELREKR